MHRQITTSRARVGRALAGPSGFTGTGLWIDFAARQAWTLLTNRVHPSRHAESGIFDLRRAVGNALYEED